MIDHRHTHYLPIASGIFLSAFFMFTEVTHASFSPTSLTLKTTEQTIPVEKNTLAHFVRYDTALSPLSSHRSEIENMRYCPGGNILYCTIALSRKARSSMIQSFQAKPDTNAIEAYLRTLAPSIDTPAIDPSFTTEDSRVKLFALGRNGQSLDIDQSTQNIATALTEFSDARDRTIELTVRPILPDITSGDPASLGIEGLIGEGTTDFKGSPKNRVHNFTRGMEQFHGLLIKPGEEFSFVEHLGEVDGEHGYLPELVIKNNETIPEFGGGICQVSSTMFRAALYSGLPITERRNHAYAVQYYKPIGMDATIYIPKPDLKFRNDTPGHILIQGKIEGTKFIFQFYGTSDGRKTEIDGPHIVERLDNGGLRTTLSQKVTTASGTPLHQSEFKSKYAPASLFPHPGQEPVFTTKPDDWSAKQWTEYKKAH
ncbi:MAG: VanW family protein [Candidatus Moraniibacteriota bacterium]